MDCRRGLKSVEFFLQSGYPVFEVVLMVDLRFDKRLKLGDFSLKLRRIS